MLYIWVVPPMVSCPPLDLCRLQHLESNLRKLRRLFILQNSIELQRSMEAGELGGTFKEFYLVYGATETCKVYTYYYITSQSPQNSMADRHLIPSVNLLSSLVFHILIILIKGDAKLRLGKGVHRFHLIQISTLYCVQFCG